MNGPQRYSADLEQGGLEIPHLLYFTTKNEKEAKKTRELMESSLIGKVGQLSTVSSMPIRDSAYPMHSWLMKLFVHNSDLTACQWNCNYRICRARRVVENVFGQLKA